MYVFEWSKLGFSIKYMIYYKLNQLFHWNKMNNYTNKIFYYNRNYNNKLCAYEAFPADYSLKYQQQQNTI